MVTQEERYRFLSELVGKPWRSNARGPDEYDCFYLVKHVQEFLFGRVMQEIEIPDTSSYRWIARAIMEHKDKIKNENPAFATWEEIPQAKARDGSIVLMGSTLRPCHLGVYFAKERSVLHADQPVGVAFQDLITLRLQGWHRLTFFDEIVVTNA